MADIDDTTEHGCLITGKWEWTSKNTAGRWSNPQQGIKMPRVWGADQENKPRDTGHDIWMSKLKIRGQGKSLSIRFESEDGKDFQLLGWSIPFTADTV